MATNATQVLSGTTYPTATNQFYQYGDVIINSAPGPGLPYGWVNVTVGGGYPGTWLPISTGTQFQATVPLTAAQIIAMYTTPVSLIAAPGAGLAIVVNSILFEMTTTATAFTGGGAVSFVYTGGSVSCVTGTITTGTITAGAGTSQTLMGPSAATNGIALPSNTGISITNATQVFAAGTGTAVVKIAYTIVTP
jgi:hypothetical protein